MQQWLRKNSLGLTSDAASRFRKLLRQSWLVSAQVATVEMRKVVTGWVTPLFAVVQLDEIKQQTTHVNAFSQNIAGRRIIAARLHMRTYGVSVSPFLLAISAASTGNFCRLHTRYFGSKMEVSNESY